MTTMERSENLQREIMKIERCDALRQAADLIDSVVEQLDTSGNTCTECGALRRYNWTEYQAAVALRHMPMKLRDHADKLTMGEAGRSRLNNI